MTQDEQISGEKGKKRIKIEICKKKEMNASSIEQYKTQKENKKIRNKKNLEGKTGEKFGITGGRAGNRGKIEKK
jgi:hypothetical protein